MNIFKKLTTGLSVLALMVAVVAVSGGAASAACNWQYTGQNMTTSSTPVFNSMCGTPDYGNEDDFLRIRANTGGAASSNATTHTDTLNAVCNNGDRFDVRAYLHNDADPTFNTGAGSAIARNVVMTNGSPLGTTSSSFNFTSRVTANNAPRVFDTAHLNCSGGAVTLSLVPNSVMLEREFTNGTWTPLGDGAANGALPISSNSANPGDVPGCWNFRVMVAYTVVVSKTVPTTQIPPTTTTTPKPPTTTTPKPPTPTVLVNTGPGSTLAMFAAVTVAGALAHRYFLGRKLARQ